MLFFLVSKKKTTKEIGENNQEAMQGNDAKTVKQTMGRKAINGKKS